MNRRGTGCFFPVHPSSFILVSMFSPSPAKRSLGGLYENGGFGKTRERQRYAGDSPGSFERRPRYDAPTWLANAGLVQQAGHGLDQPPLPRSREKLSS